MALSLTTGEERRLASTIGALLSPFDHATHIGWRRAVCLELKALLGADMATFIFGLNGEDPFFSDELESSTLYAYPLAVSTLDRQLNLATRHAQLGAYDRALLWKGHVDELHRSAYYNEYCIPSKLFDAVGLADAPDRRAVLGSMPNIILHHEALSTPSFGARGLQLLQLVLPAFRSTSRLLVRIGSGEHLALLAGATGLPTLIVDESGFQHIAPAVIKVLEGDPERTRVMREVREVASAALSLSARRPAPDLASRARFASEWVIRTITGAYTCCVSLLHNPPVWPRPLAIVVIAHRPAKAADCIGDYRHRYNLTPRESEVAMLLARRYTEREIATTLGVSVFTARRHSERVLQKLGVQSRRDVEAKLGVAS